MRRLSQSGDTIVEVLLAIAVSAAVLTGAFVVVDRTTKNARQAQEHSEALKLAEGQLELLKSAIKAKKTIPATPICFNPASTTPTNPVAYAIPACSFPPTGPSVRYAIRVERINPPGIPLNGQAYSVTAEWDSIIQGKDKVNLVYRLYP